MSQPPAAITAPGAVGRATAWLTLGNVGAAACTFALTLVIARHLGAAGLGGYTVPIGVISPLVLATDAGLSALLTRDLGAHPETAEAAVSQILWARIGAAAALFALVAVFAAAGGSPAFAAAAPLIVLNPLYSTFTPAFRVFGRSDWVTLLNLAMPAAQLAWSAWALAHGAGVPALLAINTLTTTGQVVAAWAFWRWGIVPQVPTGVSAPYPSLRAMLRAARSFAWAGVSAVLLTRAPLLVVERALGLEAAGAYAAAARVVEAARLLSNGHLAALFTVLAALAADPPRLRSAVAAAVRFSIGYGVLFAFCVIVGGPSLFVLAFGVSFAPAVPIVIGLACTFPFSLVRGVYTLYNFAYLHESGVNRVQSIGVLVLVPAVGLGASVGGGAGAAAAVVLVEIGLCAALIRMARSVP